jgi:transposase
VPDDLSAGTTRLAERDAAAILSAGPAVRKVGRPSTAAPLAPQIVQWLDTEPHLSSAELLRRARDAGYHGGKSALYDLVRRLRRSSPASSGQLGLLPGEVSRHEFARVGVEYTSGAGERLYFLASRLEWSRFLDVRLAEQSGEAGLVRGLLAAFEAFGGVPLVTAWRHARFVALSCEGQLVNWNPLFAQVALDYRFVPELDLQGGQPTGGAAPGLSRWVKDAFFRARRFHHRAHLQRSLDDWLGDVNGGSALGSAADTPWRRLVEERTRLRPLPMSPSEYPVRVRSIRG